MERKVCPRKPRRNPKRLQPRDMLVIQGVLVGKIGGQIPVMPPVIPAKKNDVSLRIRPCDPRGQGHGLTACLGIPYPAGPWMKFHQLLCQVHLLRRVEGTHSALVNGFLCRCIHLVIGISKHVGANAHIADIYIRFPIQIPDPTALCLGIVHRPQIRQKHLRTLA